MNDLKVFNNAELGLQVRTIQNDDGSISINAEDAAVGFGWTQEKNGKTYVKWERMNGFCKEFGFSPQVGKDDYIPESLFYRLGMKANNAVADKFQNWLAMEVIPDIRKNGSYHMKRMTPEQMMRIQLGMIDKHEERLDRLENIMNIDYAQQKQIKNFAAEVVVSALGGKDSKAYKHRAEDGSKISSQTFSRFWHDFNDYFNINAYANLPRVRFKEALEYINRWQPPTNMQLEIGRINRGEEKKVG